MQSKWFLYKVFVVFTFLVTLFTLTACNQEEQPRESNFSGTEFVSTSDLFSLKVPAGWHMEEVIPGADFVMANTETALERYRNGSTIEAGDFVLNIGFLPLALFQENQLAHLGFQLGASPEVFLQSLLPMFRLGDESAAQAAGKTTLVSLEDGREAGRLTFSQAGREGMLLVFEAGNGVFAFVSALGFPGEMPELEGITYAVAAEITYQGTQQALYDALYGG